MTANLDPYEIHTQQDVDMVRFRELTRKAADTNRAALDRLAGGDPTFYGAAGGNVPQQRARRISELRAEHDLEQDCS